MATFLGYPWTGREDLQNPRFKTGLNLIFKNKFLDLKHFFLNWIEMRDVLIIFWTLGLTRTYRLAQGIGESPRSCRLRC